MGWITKLRPPTRTQNPLLIGWAFLIIYRLEKVILSWKEWRAGTPIFEQKQVDMLLGLDVAHISYCRLADRALILCCNDTDMIPAMKLARVNGLQVIVGLCPDIQSNLSKRTKRTFRFYPRSSIYNHFPIETKTQTWHSGFLHFVFRIIIKASPLPSSIYLLKLVCWT